MAGKSRFHIPTLEEMKKADQDETSITRRPLVNNTQGQGIADVTVDAAQSLSASLGESSRTSHPSSPKKRMLSQKALLSRQPLSIKTSSSKPKLSPAGKGSNAATAVKSSKPAVLSSASELLETQQTSVQKTDTSSNTDRRVDVRALAADTRTVPTVSETERQLSRNEEASAGRVLHDAKGPSIFSSEQGEPSVGEQDAIRADALPTLAKLGKTNSLVVNPRQRGNPILKFVRSVPWEFGNIVPDYVMGQCNCALFLSLRYHQLHPEYIHMRLKHLGRSFDLRVLLVQVDIKDPHHLLKELAKICILADCTLMLAFSAEEAGRYLESYKVYENKAVEAIMEHTDPDFSVQLTECLTRVKSVNKTDCATLLATFGSLQGIMAASVEDLSSCPGFGPQKAKRLHDVFREPFVVAKKHSRNAID